MKLLHPPASILKPILFLFASLAIARGADSDSDGLDDAVETNTGVYVSPSNTGSDPANPDTDDDGVNDGPEVQGGTDPTKVDAPGWRRVATEVHRPDLLRTSDGVFHTNNWYSLNGVDWQSISYPPHSFWINASGYGGGTFVLTGAVGQLWTSTDFRTWTARNPGGEDITNVVYGNGVFVVRKFWTTGGLWVSSNQGQNWSSADTGSVPDRGAYSHIAFGNGVFVRPAETGVMISSNGSTWSTITPPNVPAGFRFRGQVLHSAHSGFVFAQQVGALDGEVEIMTASSSDGMAWSFRSARVTTSNTGAIELGGSAGELLFVHAYESGRDITEVWCSADHGHSWRLVEAGPWTSPLNDQAFFCGNSTVLAVGTGSEIHTTDLGSFSRRLFSDEFALRLADGIRDGGVEGEGDYLGDSTATLTATPNPGYRFTGWTGDAAGTENPLTILMDADKTVGATFEKDLSDVDADGLSAYDELVVYGTDPALADSDGDGLNDGDELGIGRFSIVTGSFTWQQARTDARSRGGDLASFPTEDRWNRALQNLGADPFEAFTGLWIGASDAAAEGSWTWVNGEAFSFAPWGTSRPSSTSGNSLDFAEVSGGGGAEIGKWYDRTPITIRDGYLLEIGYASSPTVADADGDGLHDGQERAAGTRPTLADTDGDGLSDGQEVNLTQSNPLLADSDGDGINDADADPDGDSLSNLAEISTHGTDPRQADTDGDGLSDSAELSHPGRFFTLIEGSFTQAQAAADAASRRGRLASFPNANDFTRAAARARKTSQGYLWLGLSDAASEGSWLWSDGSGASYARWLHGQPDGGSAENHAVLMENSNQWADAAADFIAAGYLFERVGLDPLAADTDGDGLSDGAELNTHQTNPVLDDSDSDGLSDGAEVNTHGTNPKLADSDGDGLSDFAEVVTHGTNPNAKDSDGDGFDDLFEINTGFNPTQAGSTPDALSSIRSAVEFRFNAGNGLRYRIESSTDLQTWTPVESDIVGTGGVVTRFYSIENQPKRYFRVVKTGGSADPEGEGF